MKIIKSIITIFFIILLFSCSNNKKTESEGKEVTISKNNDPHSFANVNDAVVKHLDLKLKVDFNNQQLNGIAIWTIENKARTDEIVFDTRGLNISKVLLNNDTEPAFYVLGDEDKILGQALSIQIK